MGDEDKMPRQPDQFPLLGRMVQRGFGGGQLEVMATFALTVLLEDESVATRFTEWLSARSAVDLPPQLTYLPEMGVPGGRIDVAGVDNGTVQVVCEAKFDAHLSQEQLRFYLAAAIDARLLVLVVSQPRRGEAERLLNTMGGVPAIAITWEEICDVLEDAAAPGCDVAQFRSLCQVAERLDVAPLRPSDLGEGRTDRLVDLHVIVERVTGVLHHRLAGGRLNPTQLRADSEGFSGHRYVTPADGRGTDLAVGVRTFETAPEGPFWLRWHRDTGTPEVSVDAIARALEAVDINVSRDFGHVWVHLDAPTGVVAHRLVDSLVHQVLRLHELTIQA